MNVGFYLIIFEHTGSIGEGTGWDRDRFFLFIATTWFINSLVQAFFMPNAQEFSELIRTGGLDFALLKPIDTQFLISFRRVDWSQLSNFFVGMLIAAVSLWNLAHRQVDAMVPDALAMVLYLVFFGLRYFADVQFDDQSECDQRLVGSQPIALQLLVLHHQL